jgi:hypothetical protein
MQIVSNDTIIENASWKIKPQEALALMGSHTIMSTQACMTEAPGGSDGAALNDRTCAGTGGKLRLFSWTNSYYQVSRI